jgi:hypothetical protein
MNLFLPAGTSGDSDADILCCCGCCCGVVGVAGAELRASYTRFNAGQVHVAGQAANNVRHAHQGYFGGWLQLFGRLLGQRLCSCAVLSAICGAAPCLKDKHRHLKIARRAKTGPD